MDERRCEVRRPATGIHVRVRFADRHQFEQCWLKDISQGGIFLRTATPKPLTTPIEVVLALPDGREVTLHGTIVHVVAPEQARPGQPAGLGVAFSDLTPEVRASLAEFVETIDGQIALAAVADRAPRILAPPLNPPPAAGRPTSSFPRLDDDDLPVACAPAAPPAHGLPAPLGRPFPVMPSFGAGPAPVRAAAAPMVPRLDEEQVAARVPCAAAPPAGVASLPPPRVADPPPVAPPGRPPTPRRDQPAASPNRMAADTARRLLWRLADVTRLAGRSYYEVLGVAPQASTIEIQAACETIRRAFEPEHPPPGAADAAENVAAVIRLVDEIEAGLTDPARRAQHDCELGRQG